MAVTIFDVCKLGPITVQCIVYPFGQRPCRKRLWEHKACAQTVCLLYDLVRRQRCHKDRRDFVSALTQLLHNVKAALVRQQKIQQKNVGSVPMEHLGCLVRIPCVERKSPRSRRESVRSILKASLLSESKIFFRCGIFIRLPLKNLILHTHLV